MKKVWKVGIYARVSSDKKEQMESIPAQVESLKQWLMSKSLGDGEYGYKLVGVYEDYGFSGSNFERDSFNRMKVHIEEGKVDMILTRDLSRFARNYVTAGYYLEDYFRERGVRFVSVLDNVDTVNEVDDIVPFKNILNEMYIKDCSRRTRDGLKQRMIRGSSIASKPPYGYRFQESVEGNTKTISLIAREDETTETVRDIYRLYRLGWGMGRIASHLNSKGVKAPAEHIKNFRTSGNGWKVNTVRSILTNPKYGGYMFQGRWSKVSYKSKKVVSNPRERWIRGDDFLGIIKKDEFDQVQKLLEKRGKNFRHKGTVHDFSGILRCGDCGGGMCYRKNYNGYKCTNSQKGKGVCTAHSIKEEELKRYIKEELLQVLPKAEQDRVKDSVMKEYTLWRERREGGDSPESAEEKLKRLEGRFINLYKDMQDGKVEPWEYEILKERFRKERENVLRKKEKLDRDGSLIESFDDMINEYLEFNILDRSIIEKLVREIVVFEKDGKKKIQVYFNIRENEI